MEKQPTSEWLLYERGKNYNREIAPDLYTTVDKNERFYAGDQWRGVVSNGLPTPVFNIIKRVINYQIATMMSQKVAMAYSAMDVGTEPRTSEEAQVTEAAELITDHSKVLWERLQMDSMLRAALQDLAITGDACAFTFWDPDQVAIGDAKGGIHTELVDSVNVFFGNPNDVRVQMQPYIVVAFRETVGKLKREARRDKVSEVEIAKITSDRDNMEQSGDRGKVELTETDDDSAKTIALIKFWKDKNGFVHWKKSTRFAVIREDVETPLRRYPIAWCNWDTRKNSYHGQSPITGMVPNQVFINKMFAMSMMSLMHTAFPKAVYDSTAVTGWSNRVGEAIPINGEVNGKAAYLNPGNMSAQVMQTIDQALQYTKEMLGVSDAALGNIRPENTSAIIAVQRASEIPLENVKANLYQFVEDIGNIWFDFMAAYYGNRSIAVYRGGKKEIIPFNFDLLENQRMETKIDVGPSSYWSEVASAATLDNLLASGKLDFVQYLERMPDGLIPGKATLIEEIRLGDTQRTFMYEMMARFMETMPEEQKATLAQMKPAEVEETVLQMMMDSDWPNGVAPGGGQPPVQPEMGGEMGSGMEQPVPDANEVEMPMNDNVYAMLQGGML